MGFCTKTSSYPQTASSITTQFMSSYSDLLNASSDDDFSIPPGFSPAELLDSSLLFSTCYNPPSTTIETLPTQSFNWKSNPGNYQQETKKEEMNFSDFFKTHAGTSIFESFSPVISKEGALKGQQLPWNYQEPEKPVEFSTEKANVKSEYIAPIQFASTENSNSLANTQAIGRFETDFNQLPQASQYYNDRKGTDDGYSWRKYGQKQVKGSENPRSYYKCTALNCPSKKKVESTLDGHITEIVYKGEHNHPKPQPIRRKSSSSQALQAHVSSEFSNLSSARQFSLQMESVGTPENSLISIGDDEFEPNYPSKSGGDEFDEEEPDTKRWKSECENEDISACGRTVREPRVVVQTTSDVDILDDGYRWRKYGQKVVKGNSNPRSYYKCTHTGCPVRKHVERASNNLRAVITTYEGKHNHDVPPARGSSSFTINKPTPNNNLPMAIRQLAATDCTNHTLGNLQHNGKLPPSETTQEPFFTPEKMLSPGNFGIWDFKASIGTNMDPLQQMESMFT